jgi:hypothetical protein
MRIACLSGAARIGVVTFAGVGLILSASGCLATRSWVGDQLRPITGQQEKLETQMNNLHLERRLVLDSSAGPTFASGLDALRSNDKREVGQFVIPTASDMRTTTTSSDSGALPASRDIWSATRASTRPRFAWSRTARANQSTTTAHEPVGAKIGESRFSFTRKRSRAESVATSTDLSTRY